MKLRDKHNIYEVIKTTGNLNILNHSNNLNSWMIKQ